MLKRLFLTLIISGLIISIGLACAIYYLKPFLEEKFLEVAKKGLGKDIELSEFDISLLKGMIFLKGLKINDIGLIKYKNGVRADEVILDIDLLLTFLRKNLVFHSIYLKNIAFNIKNVKRDTMPTEAALPQPGDPNEKAASLKRKNGLSEVRIDRISIENSNFIFEDYSVTPVPAITKIIDINGRLEDLLIPMAERGILKGVAHLKGRLNSANEGSFALDGSFKRNRGAVDFDFDLNLNDVNLIRFEPYYSNTSFTILKDARLDISSKALCSKNFLNASQTARIYDIRLNEIAPSSEETLFGLPAKTVTDFFRELKGDISFKFNIGGTINDPKFDPGPLIKQVLSNALRDKIISKIQTLPREVIKIGEKAINENLKVGEKLKILDEGGIEKKIEGIKKELKNIIEYKP